MDGICELIIKMQDIFRILRVLAFLGAGFILANYAWQAITTGKINSKDNIVEGAKSVGVPMLIGFILLFSIGIILQALLTGHVVDCATQLTGWR